MYSRMIKKIYICFSHLFSLPISNFYFIIFSITVLEHTQSIIQSFVFMLWLYVSRHVPSLCYLHSKPCQLKSLWALEKYDFLHFNYVDFSIWSFSYHTNSLYQLSSIFWHKSYWFSHIVSCNGFFIRDKSLFKLLFCVFFAHHTFSKTFIHT